MQSIQLTTPIVLILKIFKATLKFLNDGIRLFYHLKLLVTRPLFFQLKPRSTSQGEKKYTSTEKNISLSVLQKYFSGSLKDAAKSLGGMFVML